MKKRKIKKIKGEEAELGLRTIGTSERLKAYGSFLSLMWRAHPWLAFLRSFLLVSSAVLQPLQVYVFSLLIGAIGAGEMERAPLLIVLTIGSFAAGRLAEDLLSSTLEAWYSRSVSLRAYDELYSHLARIPPEALLEPEVRRDLDFAREDMWRINNLPRSTEQLVRSAVQVVGAISLGFLAPWWVLGLVLCISFLQALNSQAESKRNLWTSTWNSYDGRRIEYTRYLFMLGEDFREIRLLEATGRILNGFRTASRRILQRFRKAGINSATARGFIALLQGIVFAAIIIGFAPAAFRDPTQLALLYIAINLFTLLGDGLNMMASSIGNLSADLAILARVRHLLTFPIESEEGVRLPKGSLRIEFQDVSYRYRGAKKDALSHVNLTITEGEHLAVVGENGAGKSTFLRLLAGLDQPTSGFIKINGKPLTEYKKAEWRRAFHLMLQEAKLFQDFLGENLMYGQGGGKWKTAGLPLLKGIQVAGADAVVREVPNGLGAFIGDWAAPPGVVAMKVSGGQKQRLIIARTLIRGGRFIAFDEPTSAMDALAETAFFERLHEIMEGRGIIYISHRFSTVRRASRILVFAEGQMIEDGSHEDLLAKDGTYAHLYRAQAKWYS